MALGPVRLQVLEVMADGRERACNDSAWRGRLAIGQVHAAINGLLTRGLVSYALWTHPPARRSRTFRITPEGLAALAEEQGSGDRMVDEFLAAAEEQRGPH